MSDATGEGSSLKSRGGWAYAASPYHRGEIKIQERVGSRDFAERTGRQVIRDYMPDQHREFFGSLPYIFMGSLDSRGRPWASMLCGPAGFLQTPNARTLSVAAHPLSADPAAGNLKSGAPVSFVGVQLNTRRRNRLTGHIREVRSSGFDVAVDQSFGNCPQYIQVRQPVGSLQNASFVSSRSMGTVLDEEARQLILRSDTLFISSASPAAESNDPVEGADVNHRGGKPGFVRIERLDGRDVLTFPDFVGNSAFNTLGNIELNPRAGLLFVDFDTGNLVTMTCQAEIIWDGADLADFRGAERLLRLTIEEAHFLDKMFSWTWSEPEQAPQLADTGSWKGVEAARQARLASIRERPFRIISVRDESPTVKSIYIAPEDGAGLSGYDVGQHVVVAVPVGQVQKRAYSLSREPGHESYRISVRRSTASRPEQSVSNWLHDVAKVGTEIGVLGPFGTFKLEVESKRSVVLLAGGIGITPLLAMAKFLTGGTEVRLRFPDRAVWLIHAVTDGADHPFREEIAALAACRSNFRAEFVYSSPRESDRPGIDFHAIGHLGRDLLRALLPLDDYDVYICGPAEFMQAVYDGLSVLGVPDDRIRYEAFGPNSIRRRAQPSVSSASAVARRELSQATLEFARSQVGATWNGSGTLLDVAESAGLVPPWSCRSGRCGTCLTRILEGRAFYPSEPEYPCPEESALICIAEPATQKIILDI